MINWRKWQFRRKKNLKWWRRILLQREYLQIYVVEDAAPWYSSTEKKGDLPRKVQDSGFRSEVFLTLSDYYSFHLKSCTDIEKFGWFMSLIGYHRIIIAYYLIIYWYDKYDTHHIDHILGCSQMILPSFSTNM